MVDVRLQRPVGGVLGSAFVALGANANGLPKFGHKCGVVSSVPLLCNGKWRLLCRDLEISVSDILNIQGGRTLLKSTPRRAALSTARATKWSSERCGRSAAVASRQHASVLTVLFHWVYERACVTTEIGNSRRKGGRGGGSNRDRRKKEI